MIKKNSQNLILLITTLLFFSNVHAQRLTDSAGYILMPASDKYHQNNFYKKLWGEHYRAEWHTPVLFKKAYLDTMAGGLTPYQMGGGRQTKTIRLHDKNNREYVLRSIDKTFSAALPENTKGTFLEKVANDQVTFAHPYAALVASSLAQAAGLYHARPAIRFIPRQDGLKQYNDSAGDVLYLFEQRADENWETAGNFAYSPKVVGTKKMLERILEDNDHLVDQKTFLRARLFDMLIGDWGRHEDQWRWATKDSGKQTIYLAIPRDRDNAFSKMDGLLLGLALDVADADHMENFGYKIKDVPRFNFTARHLDHHLLTGLSLDEWSMMAADIRQRLTDTVIENAVKQMPPEVYPLSGPEIIAKLKSRRDLLKQYAEQYYRFLAKEVEITGSENNELFMITAASNTVTLAVYKISKEGEVKKEPIYSRTFIKSETKEIRLYGIGGNDRFVVEAQQPLAVKVRLIGSKDNNDYKVNKAAGKQVYIYDDKNADIKNAKGVHSNLSADKNITKYRYDYFKYNEGGVHPIFFYSNFDRIYAGLAYDVTRYKWRKDPYGAKHHIDVKYSFVQKTISSSYTGIFPQKIGNWNLNLFTDLDLVRWRNFYGLGNMNSINDDRDYNRVRSKEFMAKVGTSRDWNKHSTFYFNTIFQHYDVIYDTNRIVAKIPDLQYPDLYGAKQYAGAEAGYIYRAVNNKTIPTKGVAFLLSADGLQNLSEGSKQVIHYNTKAEIYQPLSKAFGIKLSAAASTLSGKPEFYQYNTIGGTNSMRGLQRDRFYGNSTVSSQNEIRYLPDVRTWLFNGKMGIFGFYDFGRVWLKGQKSDQWHGSYGGGIMIVPFNKIAFSIAYGVSKDDSNLHFDIIKPLF